PGRNPGRRRGANGAVRGPPPAKWHRRRRLRAVPASWGRPYGHIGWPAMSPPAHSPRSPRTSAAPPRVAFLGPSGTFTEQALLSQPDLASGELVPMRSIAETIFEVDSGRAELGVVPIENAIEGSV